MTRQDLVRLAHAHGIGDTYTNWCGEQQALTDSALSGWVLGDADFVADLQKRTQRRLSKAQPGRPVKQ